MLDVLDASSQLSSHLSGEVGRRPIHSRPGGDRVRLLKIRNPHAKDDPGRSRKVRKGMGRNSSRQKHGKQHRFWMILDDFGMILATFCGVSFVGQTFGTQFWPYFGEERNMTD